MNRWSHLGNNWPSLKNHKALEDIEHFDKSIRENNIYFKLIWQWNAYYQLLKSSGKYYTGGLCGWGDMEDWEVFSSLR